MKTLLLFTLVILTGCLNPNADPDIQRGTALGLQLRSIDSNPNLSAYEKIDLKMRLMDRFDRQYAPAPRPVYQSRQPVSYEINPNGYGGYNLTPKTDYDTGAVYGPK